MENCVVVPQKMKNSTTEHDPAIPILDRYLKVVKGLK